MKKIKREATFRIVQRLIKSKARQGKAFENMLRHALQRIAANNQPLWFMRIYDYRSFIRLNPRFQAPRQPADFLACYRGRFYLLECKSSQANRFTPETFKPHQEKAMHDTWKVFGGYWLLILHRTEDEQIIFAYDWQGWQKLLTHRDKRFSTIDWETVQKHAVMTFKREKNRWNLEPLFLYAEKRTEVRE